MKKNTPFKDLKWQHVGPRNVSGRCTDIAVITPKGKNYTIYVATASGGVWKTENEGTTWEPIFDQEASTSIGDVTLAPSNNDIMFIGTGEPNIFRSSMAGSGVYKSTDAGKTWQHMGLTGTHTIARIVIHPKNPDVVYVAASGHEWTNNKERGVYKTVDGGKNWERILYVDEETGANDLIMDPTDSNTLYASTWQRMRNKWNDPRNEPDYKGSGVYKTNDGGKTWKPINKGLPEPKFRGRIGIDLCLSKPNVVYAFVDSYEFGRELTDEERASTYGTPSSGIIKGATVYRSDDKGESWTEMSGNTEETKRYMMRHSATYGWVFGQMRVDPNDENTIYTMGLALNVSNDGGKTFRRLGGMHGDHHGLWIDPDNSNYIINVNDGGIVISYDKGETWRQFLHNLPVCQFFNIAYDMDKPFRVYGSMQDHGSFRGIIDFSEGRDKIPTVDFERAPGGEGSSHVIDPTNPNIVYSAGFYGNLDRSDLSISGNDRTKRILPKQSKDEPKLRGQWVAPFILSPHDSDTIYHGMQYLFRSRDRGESWERISKDLSYNNKDELGDIPYQTIFSISESPLQAGLIYAGTDDGKVHITKDGGKTWKEIMKGLPYQKWVSELVASAYDLNTVYMAQ
ncbi:MAG: WD40/YVTN/BNR-like repeat-containing protein, partial [Planctomycetota bacterium]